MTSNSRKRAVKLNDLFKTRLFESVERPQGTVAVLFFKQWGKSCESNGAGCNSVITCERTAIRDVVFLENPFVFACHRSLSSLSHENIFKPFTGPLTTSKPYLVTKRVLDDTIGWNSAEGRSRAGEQQLSPEIRAHERRFATRIIWTNF